MWVVFQHGHQSPHGNKIEEDVPDLVSGAAALKAKRKKYTGEEASKLEDAVNEWDGLPWDGYRKLHPTHGKISKKDFAKVLLLRLNQIAAKRVMDSLSLRASLLV